MESRGGAESPFSIGVQAMLKCFQTLFEEQIGTDIVFVLAEGDRCGAHRAVCSAWSIPLRKMLMQRTSQKECVLSFVKNPASFTSFLRFLYSGQITIDSFEEGVEQLEYADRFQIPALSAVCEQFLLKMLDNNSCPAHCRISLKYSLPNLRKAAIDHLVKNFSTVSETPGFLELDPPTLVRGLLAILYVTLVRNAQIAALQDDNLDVDSEEKVFEKVGLPCSSHVEGLLAAVSYR